MRHATATLFYNGTQINGYLSGKTVDVSYSDPAAGESDSVSVTVLDRDKSWIGPWRAQEGDRIRLELHTWDWAEDGDHSVLECGEFAVDDVQVRGMPITVQLSGVSAPRDEAFGETARTKTWEGVTAEEIGQEIAQRYGMELEYEADTVQVQALEQAEVSDSEFLQSLCETYGLALKCYDSRLVIYSRAALKAKAPVFTLRPEDLTENGAFDFAYRISGTYTGAKLTYTDPDTGGVVEAQTGEGPRWLELNEKAADQAEALRIAESRLEEENHGAVTFSCTLMGRTDIAAGQTCTLKGFGELVDGKYFLDGVEHRLGGGYTTQIKAVRVDG